MPWARLRRATIASAIIAAPIATTTAWLASTAARHATDAASAALAARCTPADDHELLGWRPWLLA